MTFPTQGVQFPLDGHPQLVGEGERWSRCGHSHHFFSNGAPGVDNDWETYGLPVKTLWLQVDDVNAPTEVIGQWISVDDSTGAAVWVPLGGGGFTGDAGDVPFTPVGTIAATDTQAAVAEVASDAATALSGHAGAADPHTDYRLESADHSHASTGMQAGQLVQANTHGTPDTDTGAGSLHHTIGVGATQAAAGNHAHAYPALTNAAAFITAETTISLATYADIAGASVSLAAGTWLIMAHVVCRQVNAIMQCFGAITDGANAVIAESAISRPASGTAALNSVQSMTWMAIVSPGATTTYKLRGARGLTTHTGSWIAVDGTGFNTANHASNNSDKGTSITAVRIA